MERRTVTAGRWSAQKWEAVDVLPDPGGEARTLIEDAERLRVLHPGLAITLFRDEAEGYYLNLASPQPFVFVMWRSDDGPAIPKLATASYNEAARLMDGGASFDGVVMPADMVAWLREFTEQNYTPEPKKRRRPPSFQGAKRDEGETR
jgi:hypothetical protein